MSKLLKVFKKSLTEGFGCFIWQANDSAFYPYTYTPRSLLEDRENLNKDAIRALNELNNDGRWKGDGK